MSEKKFERALERDRVKLAILDEASVVCSTLSFSGSGMFARMTRKFDVVVVDEAAQAVEPSTLVPLCYGANAGFGGGPGQLPATVLSSAATHKGTHGRCSSVSAGAAAPGAPPEDAVSHTRKCGGFRRRRFTATRWRTARLIAAVLNGRGTPTLFRPFVFFDVDGTERRGGGGHTSGSGTFRNGKLLGERRRGALDASRW